MKETTAQSLYLKKLKSRKRQITALRLILFLGFLALWEAAADFGWIDSFIFSSPSGIAKTF